MEWTTEQLAALDAIERWRDSKSSQVFYLAGPAGTGKSTLASEGARRFGGRTAFCAYTGKATLVMRRKGCADPKTIHKLIYQPKDRSKAQLFELQHEYAELTADGAVPTDAVKRRLTELEFLIKDEQKRLRKPMFDLNADSEVKEYDLVCLDEMSMVGRRIGEDLMSFGVPMLITGDEFQLPPVADGGFFTNRQPDFTLREIHRQAAGSPVIQYATMVRTGQQLPLGTHGESKVVKKGTLKIQDLAQFDQIIVGRNRTRRVINRKMRTEVLGRTTPLPQQGDRLVCLRNDHEIGLMNGAQWTVLECQEIDGDRLWMALVDEDGAQVDCDVHRAPFEDREVPFWDRKLAQEFDYAYAMTCHKAQGSQFDRVVVVDESGCFANHPRQWLYTAITRAAEAVTVIQ